MNIRRSVFSGSWYPGSASGCEKEIRQFLKDSHIKKPAKQKIVGGIVPHAGWYFSGSIACNVISCMKDNNPVDVIAVFGMHLPPGAPRYIMTDGTWETPFGDLPIENDLSKQLAERYRFTVETADDFTQDNTIELQLPFIKYFFDDVKIIPIGVPPDQTSLEIGRTLVTMASEKGIKAKVIGSTDLTHYGANYGFTSKGTGVKAHDWVRNENDKRVIDAMVAMNPEKVMAEAGKNHNACCSGAAATAIAAGKQMGADKAEMIAYATSYEKSPGDSFVGYVGIVF